MARAHTPITSGSQQGAMGAALSAKRGKIPFSKLRGAARQMYRSMSEAELERHLEESKGKKLPKYSRKSR